jgi:hypothetical protein
MTRVGLISCVAAKSPTPAPAKDLYNSPLFRKSRAFVEQHCHTWFILSAEYGLLEPSEVIEPYEQTLNTKSRQEREQWAGRVWQTLRQRLRPNDHVMLLAGRKYREALVPLLEMHGCSVEVPMEGLGIGQQLQWLSQHTAPPPP